METISVNEGEIKLPTTEDRSDELLSWAGKILGPCKVVEGEDRFHKRWIISVCRKGPYKKYLPGRNSKHSGFCCAYIDQDAQRELFDKTGAFAANRVSPSAVRGRRRRPRCVAA